MTKVKKLTKKELSKLKVILEQLEWDAYYPYKNRSGGFSEAKMYNYDEELIDVELKFGIQDMGSGGSVEYTENITIDRETMEVIN